MNLLHGHQGLGSIQCLLISIAYINSFSLDIIAVLVVSYKYAMRTYLTRGGFMGFLERNPLFCVASCSVVKVVFIRTLSVLLIAIR